MRADATDAPELNDRAQEQSFLYDAFISYDHDDRPVAHGIQRGLHRIGRRMGRLHALRVFRDSTDLSASPDLWGKVTEAMDRSRYMIVVLSPHAVASAWVNKEVAYWLEYRGPDQLLFVVAGGQLPGMRTRQGLTRTTPMRRYRCSPSPVFWRPSRSTSTSATMPRGIPRRSVPGEGHRPGRPDSRQTQIRTGQRGSARATPIPPAAPFRHRRPRAADCHRRRRSSGRVRATTRSDTPT